MCGIYIPRPIDERILELEHLLRGYQSQGTDVACGLEAGDARARSTKWAKSGRLDGLCVSHRYFDNLGRFADCGWWEFEQGSCKVNSSHKKFNPSRENRKSGLNRPKVIMTCANFVAERVTFVVDGEKQFLQAALWKLHEGAMQTRLRVWYGSKRRLARYLIIEKHLEKVRCL